MKKAIPFFILFGLLLVLVNGCRQNPFSKFLSADEPDSLYTGKKYVIQNPFKFPPVENKYADLQSKGVEFVGPPEKQPWGTFVILKDSEGNQIVLSAR